MQIKLAVNLLSLTQQLGVTSFVGTNFPFIKQPSCAELRSFSNRTVVDAVFSSESAAILFRFCPLRMGEVVSALTS